MDKNLDSMKIYIAGKITGKADYKAAFQKVQEELKELGHTVMSPAVLPQGFEHYEYMHICYSMIDVCEGVFFLDNWKDSKGARLEYMYATKGNKKIMFAKEV